MNEYEFCECAKALHNFELWARELYRCGFDMEDTPVAKVCEKLRDAMCNGNSDWSYDPKLGIDWIIEWTCGESDNFTQHRHGILFEIDSAEALYDFLTYMNYRGWE